MEYVFIAYIISSVAAAVFGVSLIEEPHNHSVIVALVLVGSLIWPVIAAIYFWDKYVSKNV